MMAIYRKELHLYFRSAFGYVIMALLLLFEGVFVTVFNLALSSSDFLYALDPMKLVLILLLPLIAMRTVAEERHSHTDQLLFSLPLRLREIVLGKYFAMLTLFAIPTLVTALYPLLLSGMGSVSLPTAYTALLGYFLMGAAVIALCAFVCSLVEHQILAAALSVGACLVFYFMDMLSGILPATAPASYLLCLLGALLLGLLAWRLSRSLPFGVLVALALVLITSLVYFIKSSLFVCLVPNFLTSINVFGRMLGFSYGHFDVGGTIFYISFIAVFLFFTVQSMENRRRG